MLSCWRQETEGCHTHPVDSAESMRCIDSPNKFLPRPSCHRSFLAEISSNRPRTINFVYVRPMVDKPVPYRYVVHSWVERDPYGTGTNVTHNDSPHVVDPDNTSVTYCGLNVDLFEPVEGFVNFGIACRACTLAITRRATL